MKKKEYVIFCFSYFIHAWEERVDKDFSPGIFMSKKMVANIKLAFTNVPFRQKSPYVIQKWLKFKRMVITFRLVYIS